MSGGICPAEGGNQPSKQSKEVHELEEMERATGIEPA
jgi:hypothetical protein